MTATARSGTRPGSLAASAAELNAWAHDKGLQGVALRDHSGLEPANRVTASDMVINLVRQGANGPLRPLMHVVSLKDKAGKPQPLALNVKTGTLNFVSCLVGYAQKTGGRTLCFAVLTSNEQRRAAIAPGDEEHPAGVSAWTNRSRSLQFDLVRLWSGVA